MHKKKNIKFKIITGVAAAGTVIVISVAVITGLGQSKSQKYGVHLKSANQYLVKEDYAEAEKEYLQMIKICPEKAEAYQELVSMYIKEEDYDSAYDIASQGYEKTKDTFLETVLERIKKQKQEEGKDDSLIRQQVLDVAESEEENVAVRFLLLDNIASFGYQNYVDAYGSCDVSSGKNGDYAAYFAGFSGIAYYKNTGEQPEAIDTVTRQINRCAKPYRIELSSPGMLFVGYSDFISYERLKSIFGMDAEPVKDGEGKYWIKFSVNSCDVKIETDSEGNMSGSSPTIILAPQDVSYVELEEETEGETETENENTFVLGGETFSYDEKEIYLANVTIDDLSPLEQCKQLRSLILINCDIDDITPLRGCESLEELCLDDNPFSDISPVAGLKNLKYLQFHESGVSDISPIYDLDLELMNPCSDGIDLEQVKEYKRRHPNCTCFYDYEEVLLDD